MTTSKGAGNVAKLRDIVNVTDPLFGAKDDGAFVAGGSASGTDNLTAFQAADTALVARQGGYLFVPSWQYYLSGKFTSSRGVVVQLYVHRKTVRSLA